MASEKLRFKGGKNYLSPSNFSSSAAAAVCCILLTFREHYESKEAVFNLLIKMFPSSPDQSEPCFQTRLLKVKTFAWNKQPDSLRYKRAAHSPGSEVCRSVVSKCLVYTAVGGGRSTSRRRLFLRWPHIWLTISESLPRPPPVVENSHHALALKLIRFPPSSPRRLSERMQPNVQLSVGD